ncbi:hypothetical protein [Serratia ureilytica]|uniref:hypothetical protein n=1 Tax=Serratia ureilytica TaxID=300181 RepID=UPI0018E75615|nr:hypothetical protein [Serratia ureilytica]MBJ2082110.1 hypothetical protein [Serratia ureilytica]
MAKYRVTTYSISIKKDSKDIERVYLDASLINSKGNIKSVYYWMVDDSRASIQSIYNDISQGLTYAVTNNLSIEISEYPERTYLFFSLPSQNGKVNLQYTGAKI